MHTQGHSLGTRPSENRKGGLVPRLCPRVCVHTKCSLRGRKVSSKMKLCIPRVIFLLLTDLYLAVTLVVANAKTISIANIWSAGWSVTVTLCIVSWHCDHWTVISLCPLWHFPHYHPRRRWRSSCVGGGALSLWCEGVWHVQTAGSSLGELSTGGLWPLPWSPLHAVWYMYQCCPSPDWPSSRPCHHQCHHSAGCATGGEWWILSSCFLVLCSGALRHVQSISLLLCVKRRDYVNVSLVRGSYLFDFNMRQLLCAGFCDPRMKLGRCE